MIDNQSQSAQEIIEICNKLLDLPISTADEKKIKLLLRIVEKSKRLTIDQAMIVEKIRNYYLGDIDNLETKELIMRIVYVKEVTEFPQRCIAWANRDNTDMFDLKMIEAAARNFAYKLKVPIPLVAYIFRDEVFFEIP